MLYLIGLGIWDERDISLKGLEILKRVDKVFIERYTCMTDINIKNLESMIGKEIVELKREEVENAKEIVRMSKNEDVALLVPGDVFSATTHAQYIIESRKEGVKVRIIHGSSVFTAIAKTGLSLYRFGRVVSIPFPKPGYFPTQYYEHIKENLKINLHTLVLLDIGMRIPEAIEILEKVDKDKIINKLIACYALGSDKEKIFYTTKEKIKQLTQNLDKKAQCLIIPAKLEFYEEEILEEWRVLRDYI